MNKGQKLLLNALIDKYERGTGYVKGEKPTQRIKLNLYNKGKRDFELYDIEKSEIRSQYNADVLKLKDEKLIDFKWMPAEEGHIIAEVWLIYEQIEKTYQLLGRTPKSETVDEVLLVLMEAQEKAHSQWLLTYLDDLIDNISKKRSVGSLLPSDIGETKDYIHALVMTDYLQEDETLERVFSMRCFGTSKRFESVVRSRFIRIMRKYINDIDDDANDEEVLRRVGIVKYPEQIEFCGEIQIEMPGGIVNYAPLQYGATVNAKDVRIGDFLPINNVNRILFIENRANFIDYIFRHKSPDELVVFHGGCYSPVKGLFFQKLISAAIPGTEFYHWGDIDYGGFSMLARLRREISPAIKPYLMSDRELLEYKDYTVAFGDFYLQKIEELKKFPELEDCIKCIDFMILNKVKLEQEAMIVK